MQNQAKGYILLVDDEQDFLETTSYLLRAKGYDVKVAETGEETFAMIKASRPRLIFLDINMPEMNGIEILKKIRSTDKDLPIIMVTAATNDDRMAKARDLGISGFFPKKGSFEQLGNILEVSLRMHK